MALAIVVISEFACKSPSINPESERTSSQITEGGIRLSDILDGADSVSIIRIVPTTGSSRTTDCGQIVRAEIVENLSGDRVGVIEFFMVIQSLPAVSGDRFLVVLERREKELTGGPNANQDDGSNINENSRCRSEAAGATLKATPVAITRVVNAEDKPGDYWLHLEDNYMISYPEFDRCERLAIDDKVALGWKCVSEVIKEAIVPG